MIYTASILMIAAMSGVGLLVSNNSDSLQQAMFLMLFIMLITMLMSGLFTPTNSMPLWAQGVSAFFPPRSFMQIMRDCYLKGIGFVHLW